MKALILAAGKGTKLNPFSNTRPIPMISVAGKTLLENSLCQLKNAGITDVYIVVGHHKERVQDFIAEKYSDGMNIHCLEQKKNAGIGDAVRQVKDKISPGEYFLLIYGDTLTDENICSKVQQSFHSFKCPVASICLPPSNESFGNVFLNAQMKITKIVEKPKGDNFGNYVLAGVFILPESFIGLLEKNKLSMEKSLKALVKEDSLMASMWEDEWLDIVYPWEILQANRIILDSWTESSIAKSAVMESNVTIQGVVNIEEDVVIKAGAVLEGPCSIGRGTYIGNNSLVRSYTSIGSKCSVGYGVELKNCVVLDNSGIGRLSFVGDSVIGENVDLGAGCMTVNRTVDWQKVQVKNGKTSLPSGLVKLGAFVGDGVTIGAGNTIQPGTVVSPGKILPARYSVTNKT
ncbi:MAG TPA: bifunctional sugar-1-phosphate nucleotidylyltransferase/acetyltransferase [Nitrospinaceae bacterium]|jgi:bifunctional UDP-N-acetylglucosamine pyrophosphorylase/glucosamine-1-phosphate N-acetyltransferase|nr:bifunctional sugar-1-phosphate nucleotidylyltransferase/acetyltransferase [Nitrospinaceae bacterium]|tara:strand:- start:129 stop:1337 length:1209 start_codon:yes stop_codon:yes gene_type:complete